LTLILAKTGNVVPNLVRQNCWISSFEPGSCQRKSFAGNASTSKPRAA
jgi:hypothetical protein